MQGWANHSNISKTLRRAPTLQPNLFLRSIRPEMCWTNNIVSHPHNPLETFPTTKKNTPYPQQQQKYTYHPYHQETLSRQQSPTKQDSHQKKQKHTHKKNAMSSEIIRTPTYSKPKRLKVAVKLETTKICKQKANVFGHWNAKEPHWHTLRSSNQ